ncbi:hypothetical protein ACJVC5_13335 [Peredibacter sp. HCB2-198]|uniref:hypothetical protein n=1 Tax=Peredibacter sp. HCB2-198 TaxID=3383025 RepID=UPI0038B5D570
MFKQQNDQGKYKFKVVVVECPYDIYTEDSFTRNFMTDLFKLKFEGYMKHYPYGIMPVSDYDFMATHVCLCIEEGNKIVPLAAFKSISNEICKKFRAPFPVISHKFGMYKENFKDYVDAITQWQNNLEAKSKKYAYNASWTMRTDLDKELRNLCREISQSLFFYHYHDQDLLNVINSTACSHGVNTFQEYMGLKYLKSVRGEFMEPFKSPVFFEEPFAIMYLEEPGFSELFAKECQKYKSVWENRLIINKASLASTQKKAA